MSIIGDIYNIDQSLTGITNGNYIDVTSNSIVNSGAITTNSISSNTGNITTLSTSTINNTGDLVSNTIEGSSGVYFQGLTSNIQNQIDSLVSASAGGGGYFTIIGESSTLLSSTNNGYVFSFGGNQTAVNTASANGSLLCYTPACTLIYMAVTATVAQPTGSAITVGFIQNLFTGGGLKGSVSLTAGVYNNTGTFTRGFNLGDTFTLKVYNSGSTIVDGSVRVTCIFQTNGVQGAAGLAATVNVGTVTSLPSSSAATVTNSGTTTDAVFNFGIPKGAQGAAATINVGTVTNLAYGSNATVTNTGSITDAIFNFGIPQGATGATGLAAVVSAGTVTTLPAGSNATVTNVGTTTGAIFNFGIPQGIQGAKGDKGDKGDTGDTTAATAAAITSAGLVVDAVNNVSLAKGFAEAAASSAAASASSASAAADSAATSASYARHFIATDLPKRETCNAELRVKDAANISTVASIDQAGNINATNSLTLNPSGGENVFSVDNAGTVNSNLMYSKSIIVTPSPTTTQTLSIIPAGSTTSVFSVNKTGDVIGKSLTSNINSPLNINFSNSLGNTVINIGTNTDGISPNYINIGTANDIIYIGGTQYGNGIFNGFFNQL